MEIDQQIQATRSALGKSPRDPARLRDAFADFEPPAWMSPDDLARRIYEATRTILRDGRVRWGAVIQAPEVLFRPRPEIRGAHSIFCAQIVYAARSDVPLRTVRSTAERLFALREEWPEDLAERQIADMLRDERERALGWRVPASLSNGRAMVTTLVMIHREHLPGGVLAFPFFPILADPTTLMAVVVPKTFWSRDLGSAWRRRTESLVAARAAIPTVRLTPVAAEQLIEAAGDRARFWVRVSVNEAGDGVRYVYGLELEDEPPHRSRDLVHVSHGVTVVVAREHRDLLIGTVLDYQHTPSGSGFRFENPNAAESYR